MRQARLPQLRARLRPLPFQNQALLFGGAAAFVLLARAVLGLGRGLGRVEFDGLRVEMSESRRRFTEYTEAILEALETGYIEYDGELYQQPRVAIRPRPLSTFKGRTFASARATRNVRRQCAKLSHNTSRVQNSPPPPPAHRRMCCGRSRALKSSFPRAPQACN